MPSKMASVTVSFGMAQIPFGVVKAEQDDDTGLKTLCECGEPLGPLADDDGNKVACKSDDHDGRYPWYNSAPGKGYELGDDLIPLDPDDVADARSETPVDVGNVEKVCAVKDVLLEYAVAGNYYLTPDEEYADQYGALVAALNEEELALLTYFDVSRKTRRYAIISQGGVLLALQLSDKRALPSLEYGTDETIEAQAKTMLDSHRADDPTLPEVEDEPLKELVRESVEPQAFVPDEDEAEADAPTPEV